MKAAKLITAVVALTLATSSGLAMAAKGGNGNGNNGNGNGNGGSTGTSNGNSGNSGNGNGNNGNGNGNGGSNSGSGSSGSSNSGSSGSGNSGNAGGNSGSSGSSGSNTITLASCSGTDISVAGASCVGFFSGNLNGNNPSLSGVNAALAGWNVHLNSAVASSSMLSGLTGNTINFTQQLYGTTIVGIHYGNVTGANGVTSNNVTAFYSFDAGNGAGVDSFTTSLGSLSNATVYSTGLAPVAAVPEPGTYAMMLAGLGLMGVVSRRRKQK
jgi:hypothetical protein